MKRKVRYRLEVNYYAKSYENKELSTSSPIYTLKEGWNEYRKALKDFCVDEKDTPARVHFWKYNFSENGDLQPITIAKNF